MKLDNEEQRQIILELIKVAQFPGSAIDAIYALKQATLDAGVEKTVVMASQAPDWMLGRETQKQEGIPYA